MTAFHLVLILAGYVVKAGVTVVLWRRYGPRVRALGRLARARKSAGRPVLARATPGGLSRTFRLGPAERLAHDRDAAAGTPSSVSAAT